MSVEQKYGSDAPPGLRATALRVAMQAVEGGLTEEPSPSPANELAADALEGDAGVRSVSSSGVYRVAAAPPPPVEIEEPLLPISAAPRALRPDELQGVLAKLATR